MYLQGTREGTATASWLQACELLGTLANPPHVTRYPIKLAYVRAYATDMAYITPPGHESPKHFRRRLYTTLLTMALAASTTREIQVTTMQPTLNWPQIWQNLHMA